MTEIRALKVDGQVKTKFIPGDEDTIETFLTLYASISAHMALNLIASGMEHKEITKCLLASVEAGVDMAIEEVTNGKNR